LLIFNFLTVQKCHALSLRSDEFRTRCYLQSVRKLKMNAAKLLKIAKTRAIEVIVIVACIVTLIAFYHIVLGLRYSISESKVGNLFYLNFFMNIVKSYGYFTFETV